MQTHHIQQSMKLRLVMLFSLQNTDAVGISFHIFKTFSYVWINHKFSIVNFFIELIFLQILSSSENIRNYFNNSEFRKKCTLN
jgi:hypothetical protein